VACVSARARARVCVCVVGSRGERGVMGINAIIKATIKSDARPASHQAHSIL